MKLNKKVIATAAFAALTIAAFAAASISGRLAPGDSTTWYGTYTSGWLSVSIDGSGYGDLDVYVYDEEGFLLAKDDAGDNDPYVRFHIPYTQEINIVVENADLDYSSTYTGVVR